MDKLDRHKKLCDELHNLYTLKNAAYGDSFSETYRKLGIISAVTRISDKYNRLVNLAIHPDINKGDESIRDTLIDLGNYALMTVMELDLNNLARPVDKDMTSQVLPDSFISGLIQGSAANSLKYSE